MRPDALLDLLARERRLLLAADWAGLDALARPKEAALAALARASLAPAAVQALRDALARNQALLRAALDGLGEATRRRAQMRRGLVTYDARGARAEVAGPPRVERRA